MQMVRIECDLVGAILIETYLLQTDVYKRQSEYRSYTEQMTVLDGDSDFRRCLKPSALFRYVEQVSAVLKLTKVPHH